MAEKSRIDQAWLAKAMHDYPVTKLGNGNIRTCPVRAAFCNLLERPKPGTDGKERAYGVVLLFPEGADVSVLKAEGKALLEENAPLALTNPEVMKKLNNPFKAQGGYVDKDGKLYDGFVPGRLAISANSSQSQPPVVSTRKDAAGNFIPIRDKSGVYSGCWVLATLAPAWFDVGTNKGPTFYLQSVMVIADDENLGGVGSSNPNADFAGISITADINPADAFAPATGAAKDEPVDLWA